MPDKPLFPTSLAISLGAELPDVFQTIRSGKDSSSIISLRRWDYPKMRGGRLKFLLNGTDLATLRTAWAAAYGSGIRIDFRWPWPDVWSGLLVAVADGVDTEFDIPGYGTSSPALYVNRVEDGDAIFSASSGENDRDRVHPNVTPSAGDVLTCDFTGYRQIVAVLGDEFNPVERGPDTYVVTIALDEV
jgi:hypothetical protein